MISDLNSVTSITYVAMPPLPLNAIIHKFSAEKEVRLLSIDLHGFAAGKNTSLHLSPGKKYNLNECV